MSAGHDHSKKDFNSAFAIGIGLNIAFVIIEALYGFLSHSLALIADAGHNLSDVLGLLLAWGAIWLAGKAPSDKRTFGFRKATILASLGSALLLLVSLGAIAWEAIERFTNPQPVQGLTVMIVAGIGVVINTITALLFVSGQKEDLNIRGAYLHMAADAGVSLGVVFAGAISMYTGWLLVDPITSLIIVAIIFVGTWSLLRDSMNLALDAVPKGIDMQAIRDYLATLPQVSQIHDLHVWAISTTEVALSVHLIVSDKEPLPRDFLNRIQRQLHDEYGIEHATIQLEREGDQQCLLNG